MTAARDPFPGAFTVGLIRGPLQAISEEMFAALRAAAMSAIGGGYLSPETAVEVHGLPA